MTTYISEIDFIKNELYLSNPHPFLAKGNTIEYNKKYEKDSSILKILAIDDTFHDLTQDRKGYDNKLFNEDGPLNYLLTGEFIRNNKLDYYKKTLNYEEFSIVPGKFESKVAKSIEIKKGLQSADVRISYDEIVTNLSISGNNVTITDKLYKKAKLSNGSLNLFINTNHPSLKNMDADRMSFSNFMIAYTRNNIKLINENYLKISYFVKWFLHSSDLDDYILKPNDKNIKMNIPDESMKILSDAGISFLGDFLSVPNSGATPFIAVPCFLDSASTSISPLDTNLDVVFESMSEETIVPIVSNYFSSQEYFMCYVLNDKSSFDMKNLYNFSLALFKINDKTRKNVIDIRNNESTTNTYKEACVNIKNYIDENPELVARYYFGEVQKNKEEDNAKCGTCGAGVPYIGKIMNMLMKIMNNKSYQKINAGWLDNSIKPLKDELNRFKKADSLNGRIPFSDSRILKLFCAKIFKNNKPVVTLNTNKSELESLFKLLADYKRTGDYQQSYTVLKQILQDGNNAKCYTFTSGDELSTLVGRLLAVPSIYQIGSTGSCYLYRCNLLNATENEKLALQVNNHTKTYEIYLSNIKNKYDTINAFITIYYDKICVLRNNLFSLFENINKTKTENIHIFVKLRLWNACSILTNLIKMMNDFNALTKNSGYEKIVIENDFIQKIKEPITRSKELAGEKNEKPKSKKNVSAIDEEEANQLFLQALINELLEKFDDMAEFDKKFTLYNIINVDYHSFLNEENNDLFDPIDNKTTILIPELNLNIKNSEDEDKLTRSLIKYILSHFEKEKTTQTITQRSTVIASKSKKQEMDNALLINNYNTFIDSMKNNMLDNYKISNVSELDSMLISIKDEIIKDIETQKDVTCSDTSIIQKPLPEKVEMLPPPESPLKPPLPPQPEIRRSTRIQSKIQGKVGGDIVHNQMGGTIQDYNRYFIYSDIKKALLNLMSKCYSYVNNVIPLNNEQNIDVILKSITDNYDTDDFCNTLLFQNDSELQSDVNGFITALKTIAEQYTYSDIIENGNNELLTVHDMLIELRLSYITIIIYMLSWSDMPKVLLSNELMSFDTMEYFKAKKMVEEKDLDQIIVDPNNSKLLTAFNNMLNQMRPQYSIIYTHLQSMHTGINSIFSILCLAMVYSIYYHENKTLQSNSFNNLYGTYPITILKNYIEDSPREFLQTHFAILLNNVSSTLITKLGLSKSKTGPHTGTKKSFIGGKNRKTRKIHHGKF
jgi:hypothetical protein